MTSRRRRSTSGVGASAGRDARRGGEFVEEEVQRGGDERARARASRERHARRDDTLDARARDAHHSRADGGGGGEIPQGHGGAGDGAGDGARVETTREPKITPRIVPVDERVRVEVSLAHDEIVCERDGHGGRHHRGCGGE